MLVWALKCRTLFFVCAFLSAGLAASVPVLGGLNLSAKFAVLSAVFQKKRERRDEKIEKVAKFQGKALRVVP